jgi:hypothetical protein
MSLGEYFRSQAGWREGKAQEYPDDQRNFQSAAALKSLADYVDSNPHAIESLEPFLGEGGFSLGGEETARAVSRYGFGYRALSDTQHEEFLDDLLVACFTDAYGRAGEHGEDWTGELYPFEIDAARDDVFLPGQYFKLRAQGRQTEQELEAAIEEYRLSDVNS